MQLPVLKKEIYSKLEIRDLWIYRWIYACLLKLRILKIIHDIDCIDKSYLEGGKEVVFWGLEPTPPAPLSTSSSSLGCEYLVWGTILRMQLYTLGHNYQCFVSQSRDHIGSTRLVASLSERLLVEIVNWTKSHWTPSIYIYMVPVKSLTGSFPSFQVASCFVTSITLFPHKSHAKIWENWDKKLGSCTHSKKLTGGLAPFQRQRKCGTLHQSSSSSSSSATQC